ncbi:MAG: cysteine desulfurase family protein [Synechococcus sp.]|nr:cysteine desulfurase family protein [Synechococcus sp.]
MVPSPAQPSTKQRPPIALDFQASTPCAPAVLEAMQPWWSIEWGNPSSRQHRLGLQAAAAVSDARERLASCLDVDPTQVIFTSGATEANNLALLGHARALAEQTGRKGHLISMTTEHHAVLDPLEQLRREGFQVTLLNPGADGLLNPAALEEALQPDTLLVSVMAANNEIGVLQPIEEIGTLCRARGIRLHSDAAQTFGHVPFRPMALQVDLCSLSAHKLYGPKGVGALVVNDGVPLRPLQFGGGQEQGLRPGTLPVPLIIGMARAAELAMADLKERGDRLQALRNQLWRGLQQQIAGVELNGALDPRLPHNLNITVQGVNGLGLQRALKTRLMCSSGSACSAGAPSHVLQAIGRSRAEANASLRLSLGQSTTPQEIQEAITVIGHAVDGVRQPT